MSLLLSKFRFQNLAWVVCAAPLLATSVFGAGASPLETAILEKLKRHRVVVIGEDHADPTVKRDLAAAIAKFGPRLTHVGLEALPSDAQGLVDDYLNIRRTDATLEGRVAAALKKHFRFFDCAGYMDIIRAAKKAGMAVVALDMPDAEQKPIHDTAPSALNGKTERFMAKTIWGILGGAPDAKLLVLTGWGHARRDRLPEDILEESGMEAPGIAALTAEDLSVLTSADRGGFSMLVELRPSASRP